MNRISPFAGVYWKEGPLDCDEQCEFAEADEKVASERRGKT